MTNRDEMSGWQRGQPERHVAGRRPPSPEEYERQRLAHDAESEAHQANRGGLDWLITLEKKGPEESQTAATNCAASVSCGSIAEIARLGVPRG